MEPRQKPGRSKQDYGTPPEFLKAVKQRLGIDEFYCDLAASRENAVGNIYITKEIDALSVPWTMRDGWCWLNPPYADIGAWAQKAFAEAETRGPLIAMLIPAAVGSNWWRDWVHRKATVLFLNPRLTFVGCKDPYPKDCALLLYARSEFPVGYDVWTWKKGKAADAVATAMEQATPDPSRIEVKQA